MRDDFEKWMSTTESKVPGTVSSYASAINRISQHYSNETGRSIDIYQIKDILLIKGICTEYNRGGRFEDFGDENHGLYRAAISTYVRYFGETGCGDNSGFNKGTNFAVSDGKINKKNSIGNITMSISLQVEEVKK
ncbi:MAG: hypothetical protein LBJ31_04610 [Treponema sp.]|jgi:hypothetical protein|nr:hypothetical protein [Treponema sp.]